MPCVSEPVLVRSRIRTAECETNVPFVIFKTHTLLTLIQTISQLYWDCTRQPSRLEKMLAFIVDGNY